MGFARLVIDVSFIYVAFLSWALVQVCGSLSLSVSYGSYQACSRRQQERCAPFPHAQKLVRLI